MRFHLSTGRRCTAAARAAHVRCNAAAPASTGTAAANGTAKSSTEDQHDNADYAILKADALKLIHSVRLSPLYTPGVENVLRQVTFPKSIGTLHVPPVPAVMVKPRKVSVLVDIKGTDDEPWPFSDEKGNLRQNYHTHLYNELPFNPLGNVVALRWGGECRVEVDMTAKLMSNNMVHIYGQIRFYEGTSEDTDDLEDSKPMDFLVPPGDIVYQDFSLSNAGFGGGDHAEVHLAATNIEV